MNVSTLTEVTNAYVQPATNLRKVCVKILTSVKLKFVVFMETVKISKGPSINYVGRRGGGGLAKCLCYYISLCSKLAYEGGGGSKIGKILPTYIIRK